MDEGLHATKDGRPGVLLWLTVGVTEGVLLSEGVDDCERLGVLVDERERVEDLDVDGVFVGV